MKKIVLLAAIGLNLLALNTNAASQYLDSAWLSNCGGKIELRQSPNEDLNLIVETAICNKMKVYDYSSGRTLNNYEINSNKQSFTLSQSQLKSLSQDCKLGIKVKRESYGRTLLQDEIIVELPQLCSWNIIGEILFPGYNPGYNPYQPAPRRPVVTYEWSRNHNCKKMINGEYSNENVDDWYCRNSRR